MPRKNAQLVSTWVALLGPPLVSTSTTAMSVKVKIAPNSAATAATGSTIGMVISNMRRQ
jgi:hypothetical protein